MVTPRGRLALLLAVALAHGLLIVLLPGSTPRVRPVQAALQLDLQAQPTHPSSVAKLQKSPPAAPDRPVPESTAQVAAAPLLPMAIPVEAARPVDSAMVVPAVAVPAPVSHAAPVAPVAVAKPVGSGQSVIPNSAPRRAPQCPDAARPPVYPAAAQRFNQEGNVVLQALVGTDGRVNEVKLKQSSGFALLDSAAQDQARRWRCQVAQENGVAVAGWVQVTLVFDLE